MAKLDRLLKRFFQIKAMKPMVGLGSTKGHIVHSQHHAGVGVDRCRCDSTSPDQCGEATELGGVAADELKPVQV